MGWGGGRGEEGANDALSYRRMPPCTLLPAVSPICRQPAPYMVYSAWCSRVYWPLEMSDKMQK